MCRMPQHQLSVTAACGCQPRWMLQSQHCGWSRPVAVQPAAAVHQQCCTRCALMCSRGWQHGPAQAHPVQPAASESSVSNFVGRSDFTGQAVLIGPAVHLPIICTAELQTCLRCFCLAFLLLLRCLARCAECWAPPPSAAPLLPVWLQRQLPAKQLQV